MIICNKAIELLRDTRKMYFFLELLEMRGKLLNEQIKYLEKEEEIEQLELLSQETRRKMLGLTREE